MQCCLKSYCTASSIALLSLSILSFEAWVVGFSNFRSIIALLQFLCGWGDGALPYFGFVQLLLLLQLAILVSLYPFSLIFRENHFGCPFSLSVWMIAITNISLMFCSFFVFYRYLILNRTPTLNHIAFLSAVALPFNKCNLQMY